MNIYIVSIGSVFWGDVICDNATNTAVHVSSPTPVRFLPRSRAAKCGDMDFFTLSGQHQIAPPMYDLPPAGGEVWGVTVLNSLTKISESDFSFSF